MTNLKCLFGFHKWELVDSASSTLIVFDKNILVYKVDPEGSWEGWVPQETELRGFVILSKCSRCHKEQGYGEYGRKKVKRTPAYVKAFIADAAKRKEQTNQYVNTKEI